LEGDKILVPWDHEGQSFLYALNKLTGKDIWEDATRVGDVLGDTTGRRAGRPQASGDERAKDRSRLRPGNRQGTLALPAARPNAQPLHTGRCGRAGLPSAAAFAARTWEPLRLDGRGDIKGTKNVAWEIDKDTPDVGSLLLSSGRIYYFKDKSGLLTCVNAATGERLFGPVRTGLETIYASPHRGGWAGLSY